MLLEIHLVALDAALADELERSVRSRQPALQRLASLADVDPVLQARPAARFVVVAADAAAVDRAWWLGVRARAPHALLVLCCRTCNDETWRRWLVAGCQSVLRPPFTGLDLEAEFAAEPGVTGIFRRHPGLVRHGKAMFRYSFPSDPQYIPGIVHVVSLLAMEFGFAPADYAMNLPLAIDEAVSNAIIHGNRRDTRKRVEVEGMVDATQMRLKVRDEGEGFQRQGQRDPVRPENLLATGGRGLFLIESVMDEVRYTLDGRCIEMHKRARAPAPGP